MRFVVCTVYSYRSTFASLGSKRGAEVENKALKNINYEALQNKRKTGIGKKNSFMLAGTEKYTNVTP